MKIWVDADACPVVIKDILFRAAERTGVQLTLVANQPVRIPPSRCIKFIQVAHGFDVADIDLTTIECEGTQAVAGYVVDNKLIVKFNTQDIVDIATGNTALLTIAGRFDNGILFEGFDTISVRVK